MAIYVFAENPCPNCNKPFFKSNPNEVFNIGDALRSKKCVQCSYKLKKELDAKDDLSEDGNDNAKSEK